MHAPTHLTNHFFRIFVLHAFHSLPQDQEVAKGRNTNITVTCAGHSRARGLLKQLWSGEDEHQL